LAEPPWTSAEDLALSAHYRRQAARFRALAEELSDTELKADLLAATRLYEEFAKKAEPPET
jgi:hypothetical protein